jgi:hypothetical protein
LIVAIIIRARVIVIAIQGEAALANTCFAFVVFRADDTIVTVNNDRFELASNSRLARILCTRVIIIALQKLAACALSKLALVDQRTDIPVVTRSLVDGVDTPLGRVAIIGGAEVVVITVNVAAALADSCRAA